MLLTGLELTLPNDTGSPTPGLGGMKCFFFALVQRGSVQFKDAPRFGAFYFPGTDGVKMKMMKFQLVIRRLIAAVTIAVIGVSSVGTAHASPVYSYTFALTVQAVLSPCFPGSQPGFGCNLAPGDVWAGTFKTALDAKSLADGAYSSPFTEMHLDTGDTYWDHCRLIGTCPSNPLNNLEGYRDVVGPNYLNSEGPGFYVAGGEVIGFSAGFFGSGDASFIDFDYLFSPGARQFGARGFDNVYVRGTYSIAQVPEPTILVLVGAALLGVAATRRRSSAIPTS